MHKKYLAVIWIALIFSYNCFAQTSRYWSLNFASEPSILAGAVVGGYAENQAIYYNPAIIAETKSDNVGLSGEVVAMDFYKVKNGFGQDFDFRFSQLNVVPSFVSFFLKSKNQPKLSYQLALLTRDRMNMDITESRTGKTDVFLDQPRTESFSALYETYIMYQDVWVGGGAAYELNEQFSIGISTFLSVKRFSDKLTKSLNIFSRNDLDSMELYSNRHEISRTDLINFRLQTKVGLQYKFPKCRFGLNFTLPSILFGGQGKRYREFGFTRYTDGDIESIPPFLIVDSQNELPADYKDPLSISLGFNYAPNPELDMLGLSIEYFHEIPVYRMVEAERTLDTGIAEFDSDPNVDFMSIWYGARRLVNVSIGYRKYINKELTLLGGFRTDFDYLKNVDFSGTSNEYNNFIKLQWDVFHLTGGARINISRHRFVVGAQYSLSREKNLNPLIDFNPSPDLKNSQLPTALPNSTQAELKYNGIAVFFGFIFNFLDKAEK